MTDEITGVLILSHILFLVVVSQAYYMPKIHKMIQNAVV